MPKIMRVATAALVAVLALIGQAGCRPVGDGERHYILVAQVFERGQHAPARSFVVTAEISGKCYPLGPVIINAHAVGDWRHDLYIATSCQDTVTVHIAVGVPNAPVGVGVQCSVADPAAPAGNLIVADGHRRDLPSQPSHVSADCRVDL